MRKFKKRNYSMKIKKIGIVNVTGLFFFVLKNERLHKNRHLWIKAIVIMLVVSF